MTAGCFLGGAADAPPDDQVVVEADILDEPTTPEKAPLECPEGTIADSNINADGSEQWCHREGVMHGAYQRFYPDNTRAALGGHDNNLPHGPWIWWHDNGQEKSKGKYTKGKQTGSWTWWHPNGNRQEEGDFLQGRKAGQWTVWFDSGMRLSAGLYHNGMKNGKWIYYNDDEENTVARTESWKNADMVNETIVNMPE